MNSEKESNENINSKLEKKEEELIKRKSLKIKKEILMTFNHEDEKIDLNIIFNGNGNKKKIKYISLDLLLKKIVIDDFIEKNILIIYSFCQQCFCFLETKILFNKIAHCFQFYRSQGVPTKYLSNIITFFNILIIEMYDYYQNINKDDPCISIINKFYENVINEFSIDSLNTNNNNSPNLNYQQSTPKKKDEEDIMEIDKNNKIHMTKNIKKINNFINNENEDKGGKNFYYYSINDDDDNKGHLFYNNDKKEIKNKCNNGIIKLNDNNEKSFEIKNDIEDSDKLENLKIDFENDVKALSCKHVIKNNIIDENSKIRRTVHDNVNNRVKRFDYVDDENDLKWTNTEGKKISLEENNEAINKQVKTKDKKHFHIFKLLSSNEKKKKLNKSVDVVRQSRRNNTTKNSRKYKTQDEQVLTNIKEIKNLLLVQNPSKNNLDAIKNSIIFYKIIKNKLFPDKENIENEKNKKLRKSHSQDNVFKKKKKTEIKDYFNVLDWDEKEIGNKLMSFSEVLINKLQRKELYKAVYLKKNKYMTSPNVMENIDQFNRLSFFIMLDILSYDYPKDRAKMIEKWVKIAEYCKKINDFNDLFAINSALNNYIITGLKLTLKEVHKKTLSSLKEINKFCDCIGNYKTVRDYIANLKSDEYYLPYLGILLRDLAFYEENSKYINEEMLINLEKIEKIQIILDKFFKFRYLPKKELYKVSSQLNFFEKLENIKEEKLERIANNIEPNFNFAQKKLKRLTYIDKKYFLNREK